MKTLSSPIVSTCCFVALKLRLGIMRENNYDKVVEQLVISLVVILNDPGFQPLLSAMKYGMPVTEDLGWD